MLRQNSQGEWMVLFQLYRERRKQLFDYILEKFPQIKNIGFALHQPKQNDSIYDLDVQTYFGEGFIYEEMDGLKFKNRSKIFLPNQL